MLFVAVLPWTEKAAWGAHPPPSPASAAATLAEASQGSNGSSGLVADPFGRRPANAPTRPLLDCDSAYLLGDFNHSGARDAEDMAALMNCVFVYAPGGVHCLTCLGDLNCDDRLSPADVAIFLRVFFSDEPDRLIRCPGLPDGGK